MFTLWCSDCLYLTSMHPCKCVACVVKGRHWVEGVQVYSTAEHCSGVIRTAMTRKTRWVKLFLNVTWLPVAKQQGEMKSQSKTGRCLLRAGATCQFVPS